MGKVKVGINGFGRIGRILFRAGFEKLDIVGINDLASTEEAAHLFKYDSTHGTFWGDVASKKNALVINGREIPVSSERDPSKIPWQDWGVDIVLECTGVFKAKEDFEKHLQAGANRVVVSAPAPGVDQTLVYGINHENYVPESHKVVSNASCTTNCLAPVAKVLNENFQIEHGLMTTVHAYTNDQRILDSGHKDLRRARSAATSMIPTTTGAAKAVGVVMPELAGKIDGLAVRVPTSNVSLIDFVVRTQKKVSKDSVNQALTEASQGVLQGVLSVESAPLVSCDFNGNTHSSIVDLQSTMVMGEHLVKVFSWYDNEVGFSNRMVDLANYLAQRGL